MTSTPKKETEQATQITEESIADVAKSTIFQEATTSEEDVQIP